MRFRAALLKGVCTLGRWQSTGHKAKAPVLVCHLLAFQRCRMYPLQASAAAVLLTLTQPLRGATNVCSHMFRLTALTDNFDIQSYQKKRRHQQKQRAKHKLLFSKFNSRCDVENKVSRLLYRTAKPIHNISSANKSMSRIAASSCVTDTDIAKPVCLLCKTCQTAATTVSGTANSSLCIVRT